MTDLAKYSDCEALSGIDAGSNAGAWSEQAFRETLENPSAAVIVHRDGGGDPDGFIVCEFQGDLLAVDEIAVRTDRRRQGIASALLRAAEEKGAEAGCSSVTLEVRSGNGGAVAFYAGNGFNIAGIRKGLYEDPPDDALVMTKRISKRQD